MTRLAQEQGHVFGVWGREQDAQVVLTRLDHLGGGRYVSPSDFAVVYAGLRDRDSCFEWLKNTCQSQSYELATLKVDPRFDDIRADSRYTKLLREMKLDAQLLA